MEIREQLPTRLVCMRRPNAMISLRFIEPCRSPCDDGNAQFPNEPSVLMHRSAPSRLIHHGASYGRPESTTVVFWAQNVRVKLRARRWHVSLQRKCEGRDSASLARALACAIGKDRANPARLLQRVVLMLAVSLRGLGGLQDPPGPSAELPSS